MEPVPDTLRPVPSGSDPGAHALAITRGAKSSFALGMSLLNRQGREGMRALYAFARVVDDIADGPWPAAEKRRLLDAWRAEIHSLYRGEEASAIGRALSGPVRDFDLPEAEFLALIEGMEMDAAGPIVAPPMETLRLYCRRVAGAVGLISMRIFGAWQGASSERFALSLADALQLTNIARDVEEDARIGRLYLPAELLDRHGVPHDPMAALAHPRLTEVCEAVGALARMEFQAARAAIPAHDRVALSPALAMMGAYEVTLARLTARGFAPGTRVGRGARIAGGLGRLIRPHRTLAHA